MVNRLQLFFQTMYIDDKKERISRKPGPNRSVEKPRVVSLPPSPTSHSAQASVYSNHTNRFSGAGSPPIIDFTEWADNFRGQRFNIVQEFASDSPRFGLYSMFPEKYDKSPARWRIEYAVLVDAFRSLMDSRGNGLRDILNAEEIAVLHKQDQDRQLRRGQMGSKDIVLTIPSFDGAGDT